MDWARKPKFGKFAIGSSLDLDGQLIEDSHGYRLLLSNSEFFPGLLGEDQYMEGTLWDRTRLSLHSCSQLSSCGSGVSQNSSGEYEDYFFSEVRPGFILVGNFHLRPGDSTISSLEFSVPYGNALFHNFTDFGHHFGDVGDLVEAAVKLAESKYGWETREVDPDWAVVKYWTGRKKLLSIKTDYGQISIVRTGMSADFDSSKVKFCCHFEETVSFEEATFHLFDLVEFLNLIIGRNQRATDISLIVTEEGYSERFLEVIHWQPSEDDTISTAHSPSVRDVLFCPWERPQEFVESVQGWLATKNDRGLSRSAIIQNVLSSTYTQDRLVTAANMFEHLPGSSKLSKPKLAEDFRIAIQQTRQLFKGFEDSLARSDILSALKRLERVTLKDKILDRAELVASRIPEALKDKEVIIQHAVKARNFFAHGPSKGDKFDYAENFQLIVFFTNYLEFIFCASDLIECGWDCSYWYKNTGTQTHPFSVTKASLSWNLNLLRSKMDF